MTPYRREPAQWDVTIAVLAALVMFTLLAADQSAVARRDVARVPLLGPYGIEAAARVDPPAGPFSMWHLALYCLVGIVIIVAGTHVHRRRPSSRLGELVRLAGLLWLLHALCRSGFPPLYTLGAALNMAWVPVFVHAGLSYPSGRLVRRSERLFVRVVYAYWIPVHLLPYAVVDYRERLGGVPPPNLLLIADVPALADALQVLHRFGDPLLAAALIIVLVRRRENGSSASRWSFRPLWMAGVLNIGIAFLALWDGLRPNSLSWVMYVVSFIAVPLALVISIERGRLAQHSVLGEVGRFTGSSLTWSLRYLLHDSTLEVVAGSVTPEVASDRAVTPLMRDGRQVGALVHDPAGLDEPELLSAAAAAGALALENQTLLATVNAQLVEVQESRRRIVEAVSEERERIERNLHDGAQQRLLAAAMQLRLGERRAAAPPEVVELIGAAAGQVEQSVRDIRAIARGLHPPALAEHGLVGAVQELAEANTALPIEVISPPTVDAPLAVSAAAYFAVLEGVTNAVKHACANRVEVTISTINSDRALAVCVRDDGVGGARVLDGGGLLGLQDRVEALGGRLQLSSPRGRGSSLMVELPRHPL